MASFDQNAPQSVEYYAKEGPIHRSVKSPTKLIGSNGASNVYDMIHKGFENYPTGDCIGMREVGEDGPGPFHFTSYANTKIAYEQLASAFRLLGLHAHNRVGIYSKNRPEWCLSILGALHQNLTIVPLYDTLGPDATQYVIGHAELSCVLCSGENVNKLLGSELPSLKMIISFDPFTNEDAQKASTVGVTLYYFIDILKQGREHMVERVPADIEDLFMIMYTSGTTGVPKGVMMSQGNMVAALTAVEMGDFSLLPGDVHLSYLPLAHIFEMIVTLSSLSAGCTIGYWRGDVKGLVEDIQALRPTILVGAPRVFNTFFDKINVQIEQGSFIKKSLFQYAYSSKLQNMATGNSSTMWNNLVFNKIAAVLGGRVRLILSGSAPLSPKVQEFLRVCFNCAVMQGYGMTETTAVISATKPDDLQGGHVGGPAPSTEVKLVDVPEMNYTSSGPVQQGEICVRGPNIFKGYYKMPEKTAEEIDRDGWFHTGDVGEWLPNGCLKIIDRKKNIFKLAQGEYVAAEFLETVYLRSPFVASIFVYGDSLKNYLVAIVVPDMDVLLPAAANLGIKGTPAEVAANPQIKNLVYDSLIKIGSAANLKGFEKVRNCYLDPEPWTTENNMLTPTMKFKRPEGKERYKEVIELMYKEPRMDVKAKL